MSSDDDTPNAEPTSDSKDFETQETTAEPTGSADTLSEGNTAEIEDTNTDSLEEESEKFHPRVSRRGMLLTGGVLGLLGLGSGSAAAATGSGQIGTTTTPLKTIFANEINGGVTGDTALTSLVGGDLSIDGSGNLTTGGSAGPFADEDSDNLVEPTGSLTGIDVTDVETDTLSGSLTGDTEVTSITGDGLSISSGSLTTDAASPLSVDASGISLGLGQGVEDNGGSLTASLGNGLQFDGSGAIETAGGTSVSKLTTTTSSIDALEVTETGTIASGDQQDVNVVGGSPDNRSGTTDVSGVTMFGKNNKTRDDYATISGGEDNEIRPSGGTDAQYSTISGGKAHEIDAKWSTIGGGEFNRISGSQYNTIVGGYNNIAEGTGSVVGGNGNDASGGVAFGKNNVARNGQAAPVALGEDNEALGPGSVALGVGAEVGGTNGNSFVFSDGKNENADGDLVDIDPPDVTKNFASNEGEARFFTSGGFFIENTSTVQVTQGLPAGPTDGSGNSTASQVGIDASGNLVNISTSSARYKTNIEPIGTDTSGVLDLQPTAYEYEETGQADTGLIAEEVDDALPEIVNYDDEGRPDAVRYDRVGMFLAPEVSENRDRLETVEAAREECEETIETLEVELDAKDARVADQADRIDQLESAVENKSVLLESVRSVVDEKEARIDELEAENTKLETRLSAVEAELGFGGVTADASVADD